MTVKYVQGADTTIYGSGANAGATSLVLTSLVDRNSVALTMSDFGTIGFAAIEQGVNGKEEGIQFTGVTQNSDGTATLTGVSNVLLKQPYTATAGLGKSHAGGVSVVFSNTAGFYNTFPNKQNAETIDGIYSFTALPNVNLDPVSGNDLARRSWVLSVVNGGTVSTNQVIVAGTAGETISAGNLIYFDTTEKEWMQCDADASAKVERVLMGIAQGAGTNGNPITNGVLLSGVDTNQSGLTAGLPVYASNTPGGISSSAGTISKIVGMAVAGSTTSIYFDQYFSYVVTATELSALINLSIGGVIFGGTGADGALNVTSGTTTLNLSVKSVYNYTSISISAGATLNFSNGTTGDKVPVLKCQGNFSNAGTITTRGLGCAGGAGGAVNTAGGGVNGTAPTFIYVDNTSPSAGNKGAGAVTINGGAGGALANKNATYTTPFAMNGASGGGGGGGTTASVGTPGAGGAGGSASLGLIIEVLGDFSNTGSIDLRGGDGTAGSNSVGNGTSSWNSGPGGGGGGGGAGSLFAIYRGTGTNSGTLLTTGGAGGAAGSSTNTAAGGGSPTYGGAGGGGSGGASSFNSSVAGGSGSGNIPIPVAGAGGAGGAGIVYLARFS